ncbi:MAG: hypothetical protein P8Y69_12545, partial [Gammaproteobacteria bacterium]
WPHLLDLRSWMYEFDLASVSGEAGRPGEVLRLYEGQDFEIQRLQTIPNGLLVIANLPSEYGGETSTGTGVITLHDDGVSTTVDLVMSRRYTWTGEGENPQKATRQSESFLHDTQAMWRDRFLERLRCTVEENCGPGDEDDG